MKTRILIISFLASLPLWLGLNVFYKSLEGAFFAREIKNNPQVFSAQASLPLFMKPKQLENLEINAKSAVSISINKNGNNKVLFSKNPDEKLPIASLTKIMSSYVVLNNFDISKKVVISNQDILKRGLKDNFKEGDSFRTGDLLIASFIESDNDGMSALADEIGNSAFVDLMNLEAKHLGLTDTKFFNPTGLDPINPEEKINYSTASDLAELSSKFFKDPEASFISLAKEFDLHTIDGAFHHKSVNTNETVESSESFGNFNIIGGKTGNTNMAGGCLVLVLENPNNGNMLINVILGSDDRFGEMKKMVNWAVSSF